MDLHLLASILLLVVFAFYLSSIFTVFVYHEQQNESGFTLLKAGSLATWIVLPIDLYRTDDGPYAYYIVWLLLCLGLYVWSAATVWRTKLTIAFSVDSPRFLMASGPYAFVRHPFYLSYLATYIGTAAVTRKIPSALAATVMIAIYVTAAFLEERKFLASEEFAEKYRAYKKRVGMFLPKIRIPSAAK